MTTIITNGAIRPSTLDTPTDDRTRIAALTDITTINVPFIGMHFYVTSTGNEYVVKSLKSKTVNGITIPNSEIDTYEKINNITSVTLNGNTYVPYAGIIDLGAVDTISIAEIKTTQETGFYITDSNNNIALKYDTNGLDVVKLSTHFKSLLPSITETLPFSGKTINILGDSITDFKQWTTPLKSYLGCTFGHPSNKDELSSWGLSGSRFSDIGSSSMSVRYTSMLEADLIIVFGGTNDWGLQWSNDVGTFADRTQTTFYGALHYTFSGLIAKYPTTPIVIMTPMHRRGEIFNLWTDVPATYTANSSGITVNHRGKTLREYINIIKEVAEFYSLPVIDVYGELGISAFGDNYTTWYNSDGIHPILEGGKTIAKFVISKLNNIYKQYNIS